jgi:hypothetical protein
LRQDSQRDVELRLGTLMESRNEEHEQQVKKSSDSLENLLLSVKAIANSSNELSQSMQPEEGGSDSILGSVSSGNRREVLKFSYGNLSGESSSIRNVASS